MSTDANGFWLTDVGAAQLAAEATQTRVVLDSCTYALDPTVEFGEVLVRLVDGFIGEPGVVNWPSDGRPHLTTPAAARFGAELFMALVPLEMSHLTRDNPVLALVESLGAAVGRVLAAEGGIEPRPPEEPMSIADLMGLL